MIKPSALLLRSKTLLVFPYLLEGLANLSFPVSFAPFPEKEILDYQAHGLAI